ncbi:hypothetical protein TEHN7126_2114 [Tetragenococcus halophilus subsp. halophilus]|uniref:hypothetical protein n=1 Tax=Tetragenococcus halophilus TaxID=51669 RepID=UPI000CCA0F29|nr:hypothetical protein [Tetragenococcus halophilus]GBD74009.1 hypothetical protein TEHN7125_2169 [Tetragenococcus halophilus subsp. halophilus]GBD76415.1 hypothetical protein TEHN7126_2114 [Tetragenococcus halophilus subsp. halophilus]
MLIEALSGLLGTAVGTIITVYSTKKIENKRLEIEAARTLVNEITIYLNHIKRIDKYIKKNDQLEIQELSYEEKDRENQNLLEKVNEQIDEVQTHQYRIDAIVYSESSEEKHPLYEVHKEMTTKLRIEIEKLNGIHQNDYNDNGRKISEKNLNSIINTYLKETSQFLKNVST